MRRIAIASLFLVLTSISGDAATVVTTCGTVPVAYPVGSTQPVTVNTNGQLCA